MNIVVLDGYTLNPGDLSWKDLEALGTLTVYDKTAAGSVSGRAKEAEIVFLIKPQFELTPKQVPHGIVKTEENRQLAIRRVQDFFEENLKEKYGGVSGEVMESPIKGTHGNTEYLWHVKLNKPV